MNSSVDSVSHLESAFVFPLPFHNVLQPRAIELGIEAASSGQRVYHIGASFVHSMTWQSLLWLSMVCSVFYMLALVIYRLYFSPLARFPGPFLAKVTHWYEFYYNFVRTGEYYLKIREMHDKYGPIVRATPDELHILEGSAYHKLFVTGSVRRTDAYPRFSLGTGFEDMTAICTPHEAHRRLRAPLDRLFSRSSVMRVESRVIARTEKLCHRLGSYKGTGEVVSLTNAISSLTTDVISSIIFDEPSDYLSAEDFNDRWYSILKMGTRSVPLFKHLPWMIALFGRPLIRMLVTRITDWTIWDERARREVMLIRKRPSDGTKTRDDTTVLDHLVHSGIVEREFGRSGFARVAQLIQQAGAHNVSHTLGSIITYLLLDPKKQEPMREELAALWTDSEGKTRTPSWLELEKAPYLSAVVAEGLRMSIGGMNRTPRVFPDDDVELCGWVVPKGTPISMSSHWMHNDPDVFTNPEEFDPTRWLDADEDKRKAMQALFVPFAKGSRSCVGQNLVYMQIFHTLSQLFRPGALELTLYETTLRDIIAVHGLLFPMPPFDSPGIRVTVS